MSHQHATLGDTVYFAFAANDTSGSANDGASALADVRLGGAAASAAPVHSPTPTLLTDTGYPNGVYEVAVVATSGNGFAAGSTYFVYATLTVDSQTPVGVIGSFTLDPIIANVKEIDDDSTAASNLRLAVLSMLPGTVDTATNTHTPTTTEFQADDITTAGNDNYIGRTIMFTSGTLNRNQQKITDYTVVGGIAQFTTDAFRVAPSNNDTFIIV